MFFPKLFNLIGNRSDSIYTADILTYIDNFLGTMSSGTTFLESSFRRGLPNAIIAPKILDDLERIGVIGFDEEATQAENIDNNEEDWDRVFILEDKPIQILDKGYATYKENRRHLESFSIIYERTKQKKSGALTLIDLKGYSKNINNPENNPAIFVLTQRLQTVISEQLEPYFLNSYSGIEVKQNGDGWFLYFLFEQESFEFLSSVLNRCKNDAKIASDFKQLETCLKCYIHHAEDIEQIYKVDSLHFDMEGKDVVLVHMLEKPIERRLYESGEIPNTSNFIAITQKVLEQLEEGDRGKFKRLNNVELSIKDSEGKNKIYNPNIEIYYNEIRF